MDAANTEIITDKTAQGWITISVAFAAIPKYLPETVIGSAFAIAATGASLGLIVGAPLGGLITGLISWHWIFIINIPVEMAAIYLAWKVITKHSKASGGIKEKKKGFDVTGACLSFFGLLALTYALNRGQELGWGSRFIMGLFFASCMLLLIFYWWERRSTDPLLDLTLFNNRNFLYANMAALTALMVMSDANFLMPFYLELMRGLKVSRWG